MYDWLNWIFEQKFGQIFVNCKSIGGDTEGGNPWHQTQVMHMSTMHWQFIFWRRMPHGNPVRTCLLLDETSFCVSGNTCPNVVSQIKFRKKYPYFSQVDGCPARANNFTHQMGRNLSRRSCAMHIWLSSPHKHSNSYPDTQHLIGMVHYLPIVD